MRKKIRKSLWSQGYGRLTEEQIYKIMRIDLETLACVLRKNSFVVGEKPTSYDATVYAVLKNILVPEAFTPSDISGENLKILENYMVKIEEKIA